MQNPWEKDLVCACVCACVRVNVDRQHGQQGYSSRLPGGRRTNHAVPPGPKAEEEKRTDLQGGWLRRMKMTDMNKFTEEYSEYISFPVRNTFIQC